MSCWSLKKIHLQPAAILLLDTRFYRHLQYESGKPPIFLRFRVTLVY